MKKIDQYIVREIISPLIIVSIIFSGLFICFSSARLLAEAISESLGFPIIVRLVALKTLIALEVLIPISLYAAIIIALGRLHRDQEIIVLSASGVSGTYLTLTVLKIVIPIAVLIGMFSIAVRPWAYARVYITNAYLYGETNLDKYQAGRFYGDDDDGRVVYLKNKDKGTGKLDAIFLYKKKGKTTELVLATSGEQKEEDNDVASELHLYAGYMYRINRENEQDSIANFSRLVYMPESDDPIGYKIKMENTKTLMNSSSPEDIAESQWRLSRPFATIILALLAIPLSRTTPRQGKGLNVFIAAIVFAIYYNLNGLAQTWVEQGIVDTYPGVWWLHAVMLLSVLWLLISDFGRNLPQ